MKKSLEAPYGYLRKNSGEEFTEETVNNWYKARAFVLDKLGDFAFRPNDDAHLHVVVGGDSDLMLSIVRQVALTAHYVNYDEENEDLAKRNRTLITLISTNIEDIKRKLEKEEFLGYLPIFGRHFFHGEEQETVVEWNGEKVSTIDVDIELEIVANPPLIVESNSNEFLIKEDEVLAYCNSKTESEIFEIDTRMAQYAGRMYELGAPIENLPSEDIHDAHRYMLALDVFQYQKLQEPLGTLVNESKWSKEENRLKVKNGLSNVFCADCFESRVKAIDFCRGEDGKQTETEVWGKYNEVLCRSEHARWVIEKLIMGFRPLSEKERMIDENLSPYKQRRKQYRDGLKSNKESPAHIDLCSYLDLRRRNPDDMKYDSFLMLAIPKILESVKEDDWEI